MHPIILRSFADIRLGGSSFYFHSPVSNECTFARIISEQREEAIFLFARQRADAAKAFTALSRYVKARFREIAVVL